MQNKTNPNRLIGRSKVVAAILSSFHGDLPESHRACIRVPSGCALRELRPMEEILELRLPPLYGFAECILINGRLMGTATAAAIRNLPGL